MQHPLAAHAAGNNMIHCGKIRRAKLVSCYAKALKHYQGIAVVMRCGERMA